MAFVVQHLLCAALYLSSWTAAADSELICRSCDLIDEPSKCNTMMKCSTATQICGVTRIQTPQGFLYNLSCVEPTACTFVKNVFQNPASYTESSSSHAMLTSHSITPPLATPSNVTSQTVTPFSINSTVTSFTSPSGTDHVNKTTSDPPLSSLRTIPTKQSSITQNSTIQHVKQTSTSHVQTQHSTTHLSTTEKTSTQTSSSKAVTAAPKITSSGTYSTLLSTSALVTASTFASSSKLNPPTNTNNQNTSIVVDEHSSTNVVLSRSSSMNTHSPEVITHQHPFSSTRLQFTANNTLSMSVTYKASTYSNPPLTTAVTNPSVAITTKTTLVCPEFMGVKLCDEPWFRKRGKIMPKISDDTLTEVNDDSFIKGGDDALNEITGCCTKNLCNEIKPDELHNRTVFDNTSSEFSSGESSMSSSRQIGCRVCEGLHTSVYNCHNIETCQEAQVCYTGVRIYDYNKFGFVFGCEEKLTCTEFIKHMTPADLNTRFVGLHTCDACCTGYLCNQEDCYSIKRNMTLKSIGVVDTRIS